MGDRRRVSGASFMQGSLYSFASFGHSSTLICPAALAKLVRCIDRRLFVDSLAQIIPRFNFNEFHTGRPQLMVETDRDAISDVPWTSSGQVGSCLISCSLEPVKMPANPD